MSHQPRRGAVLMAEIFKATRTSPMSGEEIGEYLCISHAAALFWLNELEAQGMLTAARQVRGHGHPTTIYRLAPQWGGVAA